MKTNYKGGCIIAQPNKEDARYEQVFGSETPQEAFNWKEFLPQAEYQKSTAFCVSFSRLNVAETLAKKDGLELNLSDRHLGVISGTSKSGNNLNAVSEAFRTLGIVKEEVFQWKAGMLEDPNSHWEEIFDTSSIPSNARRYKGGNHSWVSSKAGMKSALAFSPLQIAVGVGDTFFWREDDKPIKNPSEILVYHALTLYWIDTEGNYYIYDSAGERNPFKVLDRDYLIMQAKSFRDLPENWKEVPPPIPPTIFSILKEILTKLAQVLGLMSKEIELIKSTPPPPEKLIDPDLIQTLEDELEEPEELKWETPVEARHSCRVVMDEFNLTRKEKDLLCAVIQAESQFNIKAVHRNLNGSADWGICQINDYYWIGKDKYFLSTDEVLNFPEKSVRFMVEQYQRGHLTYWIAFKNQTYKLFL